MDRYGKIDVGDITRGMRVRITQRYHKDGHHTTLIQEGMVERTTQRERPGFSLIPGATPPPIVETTAIQLFGWKVELNLTTDWNVVSIEEALPELPVTPGSAVLCGNGLLATLRRAEDGDLIWTWANSFDKGGPIDAQLASARVVHTAAQ